MRGGELQAGLNADEPFLTHNSEAKQAIHFLKKIVRVLNSGAGRRRGAPIGPRRREVADLHTLIGHNTLLNPD